MRIFQFENIHHALEGELVEVETVTHIVVGGDGLGVVVDHDGAVALATDGLQGLDATPVKLHGTTDTVGARSEHDDGVAVVLEVHVRLRAGVGDVEVVGLSRILRGQGVNLLHHRQDAVALAQLAHNKVGLVHVLALILQSDGACYLEVAETIDLCLAEQVLAQSVDIVALQLLVDVDDMAQLVEEPAVDLRQIVDLIDGVALVHGLGNDEDTLVRRLTQRRVDVVDLQLLVLHIAVHSLSNHAQTLLDSLLEVATDGHHLSDRLHGAAQLLVHTAELAQIPARNLTDHIVEGRLKEGRGGLGDGVLQFEESVAQAKLGGHESQGIARGLGSQGRRTGEARVDLDDTIVLALRVEGVLHVALADDADMAHDLDGERTQLVILAVGQSLRRSDDDTLTRMDAQRVEVLHVADRDAVVVAVAHHLVLYLLPALEALLHQHLGREREGLLAEAGPPSA